MFSKRYFKQAFKSSITKKKFSKHYFLWGTSPNIKIKFWLHAFQHPDTNFNDKRKTKYCWLDLMFARCLVAAIPPPCVFKCLVKLPASEDANSFVFVAVV